jgi:chromosome segregation ATPase
MKFPQDEILNTVRRRQRAIHKQKQANETIRNEINEYEAQIAAIDASNENHKTDPELIRLESKKKQLVNQMSNIRSDFKAVEKERKKLEDEVSKANSKAGGMFQQSREIEDLRGRLRTMENRLDKALVRYNQSLSHLAELREQLDVLRKDRFNFQQMINKAENERIAKDLEMQKLINESNEAYTERDHLKMSLVEIKNAEKEDINSYEQDMTRINATIDGHKMNLNRPQDANPIDNTTTSQIGSQNDQQEVDTLIENYTNSINRTLESTGKSNLQELFAEAEKIESENFSLFNFVVEHSANRTKLEESISALELQLDSLNAQTAANDIQQAEELTQLTTKVQETELELKNAAEERDKEQASFSKVYEEIEGLFNDLGCNWSDSPDEKSNVTPVNSMWALASIEAVLSELTNQAVQKTKEAYNNKGADYPTLSEQEKAEASKAQKADPAHLKADKSVVDVAASKVTVDHVKPMSIDELRSLINLN